jgi:hypothetical protein
MLEKLAMRLKGEERGAALILTAIVLLVLVGVVGLALDGGQAYNTRRGAQNAADNAALAAAWAYCAGQPDPIAVGVQTAVHNGFEEAEVEITQEPSDYNGQFRAVVTTVEETSFARVIGFDEVTVAAEATAACNRGNTSGPAAMFAKGPSCMLIKGGQAHVTGFVYSAGDMEWNGQGSQLVEADVHADGNMTINGKYNIKGTASASGTANHANVITGVPKLNLEYPISFKISDFEPGSPIALEAGDMYHYHKGNIKGSDIMNAGPGIHFVEGNITHQGPGITGGPYTLVATGTITLNGPRYEAYYEGLAMMAGAFSPPTCNKPAAIDLGGQNQIAGLLFAPNGVLEVNGGAVNGGMIAWGIDTGGNLDLVVNPDLFPKADPRVFLLD